jgi:DNA-binding transcriptional LysR family regulator
MEEPIVELRHLRYFVTVAEELNFSKAALRLGMSQPPLSSQIKQFERELGLQLFDRSTSRVTLTEPGRTILFSARQILADADALERLAKQMKVGNYGVLRIGTVGSALLGELPELIREAGAAMPNVSFEIEEIETGNQDAAFANHRIDIGIVRMPLLIPGLKSLPLFDEPLVAVVGSTHALADREQIDLSELQDEQFILFPRQLGVGLWDTVVNACIAAGFQPINVIETQNIHTIVGMVASGRGVSLLPDSVRSLALPDVRYVRVNSPGATSSLDLAWSTERLSPTARTFVEFATDFVARKKAGYSQTV